MAFASEGDTTLRGVDEAFREYERASALFFKYLADAGPRFSAAHFDFFRANYFFRTQGTVPSIELLLHAARAERDRRTAADVEATLFEENGSGDPLAAHPLILEQSHNTHAGVIFNLPPLTLADAWRSPHILDATRRFRREQEFLYSDASYPRVLGASLAQEAAAVAMLDRFRRTLFLPYAVRYAERRQFEEVDRYFSCHLAGIEQEHAARARASVRRACRTHADVQNMRDGLESFLAAQAQLWDAMLHGLLALDGIRGSR